MKKNIRLLVSILLLTISIFVCIVKANALTKLKAETDAEFFDRIEQIHESSNRCWF